MLRNRPRLALGEHRVTLAEHRANSVCALTMKWVLLAGTLAALVTAQPANEIAFAVSHSPEDAAAALAPGASSEVVQWMRLVHSSETMITAIVAFERTRQVHFELGKHLTAVWPHVMAVRQGVRCEFQQCKADRLPVTPFPFTYFLTLPMLRHTQEFNPFDAILLHLPLLDKPGTRFCGNINTTEAAQDRKLDFLQAVHKAAQHAGRRLYLTSHTEVSCSELHHPFLDWAVEALVHTDFEPGSPTVHADGGLWLVAERKWTGAGSDPLPPVRRLQMLGERNSGTTWIHHLISDNTSPADLQPAGLLQWKHQAIAPSALDLGTFGRDRNTLVLLCVKDPLAWALSMYDHPFNERDLGRAANLSDFLTRPWQTRWRAPTADAEDTFAVLEIDERFPSVAALRTYKLRSHLALQDLLPSGRFEVLRYEDVLRDPQATITELLERHDVPVARRTFKVGTTVVTGSGSVGKLTESFQRRAYYLDRQYLRRFTDRAAFEYFVSGLDQQLERQAGYALPIWTLPPPPVQAPAQRPQSDI